MTNHKKDKKVDKLWRHAEVFTDFWLGMAGAGARGLSEALTRPEAEKGADETPTLEKTVDRAARAIRVTLKRASLAAQDAESELADIHSDHAHPKPLPASAAAEVIKAAKRLSSHPPKAAADAVIREMLARIVNDEERDAVEEVEES